MDYLQLLNLFAPGNFPENQVFKLQSQTKVAGTHPRNAVCLLLASLLALPMFFIAVNSTNLAHQHWARRQLSVSTILAETVHNVQSWTKMLRKVDIATSSLKTKLLKALATTNSPPSPSKNVEIRLDHF